MKKVLAEVDMQQLISELQTRLAAFETRQAAIEARLEKFAPTPKLETLQPYRVGSSCYSISDMEGSNPLLVLGYDRPGRVVVSVSPGEPERSLPLASVRSLQQCPRAQPGPSEAFAHITDPVARKFFEGRAKARFDATTRPFNSPEPIVPQRRYIDAD